jgi:hypothetical protein
VRYPYGVTVVVQRATTDRFGDRTYVDDHVLTDCAIAPRESTEATGDRATVIVGVSLYAPHGADIRPTDRLILPDGAYQVVGQPFDYVNPFTGWAPGVEVALERVVG